MRAIWPISQIKRKLQKRKAEHEHDTPTDKAAHSTAIATWWIAAFTIVLAAVGLITLFEVIGGANDTKAIVEAAKKQADAAGKFATSAAGINIGVSDAVTKLNLQASKLEESVRQASRLAKDTEIANENAIEGDRPWFGATIAVADFEVGKIPRATVRFMNSGKRPASVSAAMTHSRYYADFPEQPFYEEGDLHSRGFVVPGDGVIADFSIFISPLTQDAQTTLDTRAATLYVYGKVLYKDIRTGKEHFTHGCVQYSPAVPCEAKGILRLSSL